MHVITCVFTRTRMITRTCVHTSHEHMHMVTCVFTLTHMITCTHAIARTHHTHTHGCTHACTHMITHAHTIALTHTHSEVYPAHSTKRRMGLVSGEVHPEGCCVGPSVQGPVFVPTWAGFWPCTREVGGPWGQRSERGQRTGSNGQKEQEEKENTFHMEDLISTWEHGNTFLNMEILSSVVLEPPEGVFLPDLGGSGGCSHLPGSPQSACPDNRDLWRREARSQGDVGRPTQST